MREPMVIFEQARWFLEDHLRTTGERLEDEVIFITSEEFAAYLANMKNYDRSMHSIKLDMGTIGSVILIPDKESYRARDDDYSL